MQLTSLFFAATALAVPAPAPAPGISWGWSWGTSNNQQKLDSKGCINLITTDSYDMGNLTQKIGGIASSVSQNDILGLLKLQTTTQKLINTINDAGKNVNGSCGTLTLNDALPLVSILQALDKPIADTMKTLTSKKESVFDHAILWAVSLSWLVKCDLDAVINGINGLAYAIRSKVPPEAGGIVDNVTGGILKPIVDARNLFADNTGLLDFN